MTFKQALDALYAGDSVRRVGWPQGDIVFLIPGSANLDPTIVIRASGDLCYWETVRTADIFADDWEIAFTEE